MYLSFKYKRAVNITARNIDLFLFFLNLDYFAPFKMTAVRANAMRQTKFTTIAACN